MGRSRVKVALLGNVRADLQRFAARSKLWHFALAFGLQALIVYRLGRWLQCGRHPLWRVLKAPLTPVHWLAELLVRWAYDIRLDVSAEIGPGLYIGHLGGIVVRDCQLGANCSIHQRVRIEPLPGGTSGPAIGDRVWIGSHAQVLGPVRIHAGATVAAGSVVIQDVPASCLVIGSPARVVRWDYDNSSLL